MTFESLGFTGSSDDGMPTIKQRKGIVSTLNTFQPKSVHHGDCINSDEVFHFLCKELSPRPYIYIHPPESFKKRAGCNADFLYPIKPYMDRNQDIVDASDVLLATPHGPEEVRSGTWATIRRARKKGIPIYIIMPNGYFIQEN